MHNTQYNRHLTSAETTYRMCSGQGLLTYVHDVCLSFLNARRVYTHAVAVRRHQFFSDR